MRSTKILSAAFLALTAVTVLVHAQRSHPKQTAPAATAVVAADPIPICPYKTCPNPK